MNTLVLPTTQFTRLLFATDFSDESRKALLAAKVIAKHFDSEISAVNVTDYINPLVPPEGEWFDLSIEAQRSEEQIAQLTTELHAEGYKAKGLCPVGQV